MTQIARRLPLSWGASTGTRQAQLLLRFGVLAYVAGCQRGLQQQLIPPPARAWLTVREASEHSGLSCALLRRLIAAGRLPNAFRDGNTWKVKRSDLDSLDSLSELSVSQEKLRTAASELRGAMQARRASG